MIVLLLPALVVLLAGCAVEQPLDTNTYAMNYVRALVQGDGVNMQRYGDVDPEREAAVREDLTARIGTDVAHYLTEDAVPATGGRTLVTFRLVSRDERAAVVDVTVVDGTNRVVDVSLE
jgi:hypothetical protein